MNKYYALNYIGKINKLYKSYIDEALLREGVKNVAVSDGNVIAALYSSDDGLTMKEIASKVNRTKSTISQLVDKLEKSGYVSRQKSLSDKRATLVVLTEEGKRLRPIFNQISTEVIDKFFIGFSDTEIEVVLKTLSNVIDNLSE